VASKEIGLDVNSEKK